MSTPLQCVFLPAPALPARGRFALYRLDGGVPEPRAVAELGFASWEPAKARLALPDPPEVTEVPVAAVPLEAALGVLARLDAPAADSLRVWSAAARAVLAVVAAGRVLPGLRRVDDDVVGSWRAIPPAGLIDRLAAALPVAGFAVTDEADGVQRPEALMAAFADAVADLAVRRANDQPRPGRPRARLLPWTARWVEALVDDDDPTVPLRDDADELVAGIAAWAGAKTRTGPSGTAELTLQPPHPPTGADRPWRLSFAVRTDAGEAIPAEDVWEAAGRDGQGQALAQALLRDLVTAANVFPPLDAALDQATPSHLDLDLEQAWDLLQLTDRLLSEGIGIVLPPELAASDLAVRVRIGGDHEDEAAPVPVTEDHDDEWHPPVGRGLFAGLLTTFRWEVAIGDEALTAEEFATIVAEKAPLVRVRDRWVRVDPERRGSLDRLAARDREGRLPLAEALALGLAGSEHEPFGDHGSVDVVVDGQVAALVDRIREAGDRPPAPATPPGFSGELRPYQRRGVAWLQGMGELGLGAVLADDMGLGKTVQFAAYAVLRDPHARPHLVVCPTSVVGNWQRELARFAPSVVVTRHHGPDRPVELAGVQGVVLTSYGTLRRDVELLAGVDWDVVALDEAQHVKNPSTAAARAVRRLRSRQTVALTGTPLENRLAELWSLLDATNPGLLGSRARFGQRFVAPIEQQEDAAAARRLRRLVAPFILRREKGDPAVVADLPGKVERTVVCGLTSEQAGLYQAAVDRVLGDGLGVGVKAASAIERRGRVLALLTELKQIGNHPAQYLRERAGGRALLGRSGKLEAARDLIGEAVDGGAQVLCFTQFVEMGNLLVDVLGGDLGRPVPFLHGGVPATARDRMVAAFQAEPAALDELGVDEPPPVLVVSLRAGGTGLNLTAATHVVHYDRWWNPAVEDQATDRAHRIGQSETVYVHKLVTAGTVEERVADMLERKRALAERIVGAGESWVTELGDAELSELVALSADAPVVDADDWNAS